MFAVFTWTADALWLHGSNPCPGLPGFNPCFLSDTKTHGKARKRPPDVLRLLLHPPPSPAVQVKKYFELEPLARGKRWILEGSDVDNMETVKDTFGQFISLLEDKDTEPARI